MKLHRAIGGIVILTLAGCAAAPSQERATVRGVVSYLGKPVSQGFIHFYNKANPAVNESGSIRKDGTYVVTNAPVGAVKIVLQINGTEDPLIVQQQGGKEQLILPRELGKQYARHESTPVERLVEPGENKIDVEIK